AAALLDGLDVVLARPAGPAGDGSIRRLAARVRERGAVLLVPGPWPGAEAQLAVTDSVWHGLGPGHGHLSARQVTVELTGRGGAGRIRRARLWLPAADGKIRAVASVEGAASRPQLRSVGSCNAPSYARGLVSRLAGGGGSSG